MARFKSSLALLPLVALGACTNERPSPFHNPTITSVNQPVVQRTDYVFDVNSTGNGVPASEAARLADWLNSLGLTYGDRISMDEPSGYGDPRAREDIARVAGAYGILLSEGAPVTAGAVRPGSVRVIVSRAVATVPGCPLWDAAPTGARITTSPNYGCAINSNLAAMVADPNDLVLGQTGSLDGGAAAATKAVDAYRRRLPSGASGTVQSESTKGDK